MKAAEERLSLNRDGSRSVSIGTRADSHRRSLRYWLILSGQVGTLFGISMGCLWGAVSAHQAAASRDKKSLALLTEVIRSGQLQATPFSKPARFGPTLTVNSGRPSIGSGGAGPPSANFSRSPLNHDTPLSQLTPIQIVIPPGTSVPPPTIALTLEINGTNLLTSPSYPGIQYVLEASMDLRTWFPLSTNTASSASVSFLVSNTSAIQRIFYRLQSPNFPIFISPVR